MPTLKCASCLAEVSSAEGSYCEQCDQFFGACCSFHFIACDADAQKIEALLNKKEPSN